MTRDPTILPPSTPLYTIQSIFNRNKFWSVYIGDSDRFLGIITRKDLSTRMQGRFPSSRADLIMSKNVFTIDENSDVEEAIRILKQKKVNGLGITRNGKPSGIITKYDIKKKYNRNAFDPISPGSEKMTDCSYCKQKIAGYLPWKCSYCHRLFCSDHRLPEYHECSGLKRHSGTGSSQRQSGSLYRHSSNEDRQSIKFLLPSLKSSSAEERKKVAILLKGRGWVPSTDAEKSSFHFARQNWDELVALGTVALEPLVAGLEDEDEKIRIACIRSLGNLGNSDAIPPLLRMLYNHETPNTLRTELLSCLGKLGWSPKTDEEKIIFLIAEKRWSDLRQFGEKIIGPVSALLTDTDENLRIGAIDLLCELSDTRISGILKKGLKDRSKKVRIAALNGLITLNNPDDIEDLILALNEYDSEPRNAILNAIIKLDALAVDPLIQAIKNSDEQDFSDIKNQLISALGEIRDARARDFLINIKETTVSDTVRKVALDAIKKIDQHSAALKQKSGLYCLHCYSHFTQNSSVLNFIRSSTGPACRNCHSTRNYLENVDKVILSVGDMNESFKFNNNILSVNWFKMKRPFDMHEIEIMQGTNEDISELVMKFKNDDDNERKRTIKRIPVFIAKDLSISQAKINLLKNTFGVVKIV